MSPSSSLKGELLLLGLPLPFCAMYPLPFRLLGPGLARRGWSSSESMSASPNIMLHEKRRQDSAAGPEEPVGKKMVVREQDGNLGNKNQAVSHQRQTKHTKFILVCPKLGDFGKPLHVPSYSQVSASEQRYVWLIALRCVIPTLTASTLRRWRIHRRLHLFTAIHGRKPMRGGNTRCSSCATTFRRHFLVSASLSLPSLAM
jgi:hypothetical protein